MFAIKYPLVFVENILIWGCYVYVVVYFGVVYMVVIDAWSHILEQQLGNAWCFESLTKEKGFLCFQ